MKLNITIVLTSQFLISLVSPFNWSLIQLDPQSFNWSFNWSPNSGQFDVAYHHPLDAIFGNDLGEDVSCNVIGDVDVGVGGDALVVSSHLDFL